MIRAATQFFTRLPRWVPKDNVWRGGGCCTGSLNLLRQRHPLPQIDKRIKFYDYVVVNEDGKPDESIKLDIRGRPLPGQAPVNGRKIVNHRYFVDGQAMRESLTSFIKRFHKDFDEQEHSIRLACESKPGSIYYGKTAEEIKEMWAQNRDNGTRMHEFLELFYNDMHDPDDPRAQQQEFTNFLQFQEEFVEANDLVPFRTELRNFLEGDDCRLTDNMCGTADMLYIRRADIGHPTRGSNVIVVDWKFLNTMYTNAFRNKVTGLDEMCLAPFDDLPDVNLFHYYIQLNGYRYMLEQRTSLHVTEMYVVDFGKSNPSYRIYAVPDLQEQIRLAVLVRKEQLFESYKVSRKRALADLEQATREVATNNRVEECVKRIVDLEKGFAPLVDALEREHHKKMRKDMGISGQTEIRDFFRPK